MRLEVAQEALLRASRGDEAAMESLLRSLWPHAYRIARSIIHDDTLAQDAAQEASATVYRDLRNVQDLAAFRVWFYRVVSRHALRLAKRNAKPELTQSTDSPQIVERLDVLRALRALSPELRAVVVLHYYADLSSAEIGAALGVPSPTVRFRLVQARRRLRDLLAESGVNQASTFEVMA